MSALDQPRAGFIGVGSQGGPMAECILAAGFPLTVWARRAEQVEPFLEAGASAAASPAELAAAVDILGICVVDDAGVADICDQVIPAMRPGSLLAIHSTILPESCEALERRCAEAGLLFLDAPVSGGGQAAAAGQLTIMCGGSEAAMTFARPVLACIAAGGERLVHLGPAGAGQRAKIINNTLLAANMGLAHAALAAGEALEIGRKALGELIAISSGRSFGFEVYARLPSPEAFSLGAPLLVKDANLLNAVLPNHPGQACLRAAAAAFLSAATGKTF